MLFSLKSLLVLGAITSQVSAHVIFTVDAASDAAANRNDVTRSGSCDVEGALAGSTVTADADGGFTALAKWFNAGNDGATTIDSATFDVNADGNNFAGKVTVVSGGVGNQDDATGTDEIQLSLPAGTTCQGPGGACLVQLSSTSGFGNCVAVVPAAANAAVADAAATNTTDDVATEGTDTAVNAAETTSAAAATSTTTTTNADCPARHRHRGCGRRNNKTNSAAKKIKARVNGGWKRMIGFSSI
ncbi:hypothetical protein BDY24DRAFT_413588 [Mrakia frigida]|uniref:uncharacterized protein n=1 Tax=Mrakia frigida TaxID=29902 RepID=UPI003FCBF153